MPLRFELLACSLGLLAAVACSGPGSSDPDGDNKGGDKNSSSSGGSSNGGGNGQIVVGDGDGDASGGGSPGGNICETVVASTKPNPPVILVLLDQSGSMKAAEGGETRWAVSTSSLSGAMSSLEQVADFGLIGFPTHVISSDSDASQTCNAELKAAPAPANAATVAGSISPQVPSMGHTPVRAALNLASTHLADPAYAEREKYVVLITDGMPNCKGISPDSGATSGFANYEDPSDAVTTLRDQGVGTFVVGYAIAGISEWSEGTEHFAETYANNMAAAGGTEMHHPVSSGAELAAVLDEITKSVAPCSFELDKAPAGGASYVRVTIDDTDYALDEAWSLEGETTISLDEAGPACAVLRDGGEHEVRIQVECQPVVVR